MINKLLILISLLIGYCANGQSTKSYEIDVEWMKEEVRRELYYYRIKYLIDFDKLANEGYDSMAPYLSGMMPDEDCPLVLIGPIKRPGEYFPDSTFSLYLLIKGGERYDCNLFGFSKLELTFPRTDLYSLVAINKHNKLLFISGNFKVDPIASYFSFNRKDPNSYVSFLEKKLFKYGPEHIKYTSRKGDFLFYEMYDTTNKQWIEVKFEMGKEDDLQIVIK